MILFILTFVDYIHTKLQIAQFQQDWQPKFERLGLEIVLKLNRNYE